MTAPRIMQFMPGKTLGYKFIPSHVPRQWLITSGETIKSERKVSLAFNKRFLHRGDSGDAKTLKLWYNTWLSNGPSLVLDITLICFHKQLKVYNLFWYFYRDLRASPIMIIPSTFNDAMRHITSEKKNIFLSRESLRKVFQFNYHKKPDLLIYLTRTNCTFYPIITLVQKK